jgi:MSHA biogenesis protein MshJ
VKAAVAAWGARWRALPRRERGLLVVAAIVCVVGAGDLLLLEPALKDRARLLRQIGEQNTAREALEAGAGVLARDPEAAVREQLETLRMQLRATEREFESMQNGLVQPQHMGALLQSLLAEQHGLRLIGLRSLPVTPLGQTAMLATKKLAAESAATAAAPIAAGAATYPTTVASPSRIDEAWLYRHAVEVRVQGSYADMLAYLRAIEGLPRHVRWGDLEIDARAYPASTMTITLFTVSLEKTWWVL